MRRRLDQDLARAHLIANLTPGSRIRAERLTVAVTPCGNTLRLVGRTVHECASSTRTCGHGSSPLTKRRTPIACPCRDLRTRSRASGLAGSNRFGWWPAAHSPSRSPETGLTARVPTLEVGEARASWTGDQSLTRPTAVLDSYSGALGFTASGEPNSLRRPRLGPSILSLAIGHQG